MPQKAKKKPTEIESIDELVEEIQSAESEVETAIKDDPESKKREELILLAKEGGIDKSVEYIKRTSNQVIDKLYDEYKRFSDRLTY